MILVTGATGTVGREVVSLLLARGEQVRAVSRDPSRADLPAGVEVVAADLGDPASLTPHLTGVEAVFLIWPFTDPAVARRAAPEVAQAIAEHASRIVYLSAPGAADQPASFWAEVERAVEASGAAWTFLRPVGFAANTLMWADQIRAGDVVRWPYGGAARSLIHERDLAEVAAAALTLDGHAGARYLLSGPATLTQEDQVRAIGRAVGRELRWSEMPVGEARQMLAAAFGDPAFADAALAGWAAFVARPEQVTDTVRQLTGHPARTYAEWAADHAAAFR
ncbi:SDR family oxidoreductase [Micromonospora sp. CB01531]|uniref:SDR family oxidoreductase n=1 Tax=Micromonospora sp. CB01531 TaxID=1718947 RepID=UPI00093E2A45|nr:NAD(P)H-binding protein [Micromonospora sp. CB01531]OKI42206.1 NmrA family transcriptional regulator [Micromonospora sp. CB01531]